MLCQSERYVRRVSWNTGNQSTMPNNNTITFLLIVVISVLTGVFFEPPPPLTKKQLLRTIDANASESKSDADLNIAVGTNICVDLIVSANDFFEVLPSLPTHVDDVDPDSSIDSEQDLVDTFAYFFGRGAAAERFVDPHLFNTLVSTATALQSTQKRLGGNAALMGNQFAKLGHKVLMSSDGGADLKQLVHDGVTFSGQDEDAAVETHIILEYGSGDEFQGVYSDRANRLILTPAGPPAVATLQAWSEATLSASKTDAVIFSGLHLFESTTPDTWRPYLAATKDVLEKTAQLPQHLELASLSNEELTKDIVATLFPVVSSIGLNEEELGALFYALGGSYDDLPTKVCDPKRDAEAKRHRILRWKIVKKAIKLFELDYLLEEVNPPDIPPCLTGKSPHVSAVTAALDYVFRAASAQGSTVSRIHFHSLAYHIIATADGAANLQSWKNVRAAAASGSIAATYQACNVTGHEDLHGDQLTLVAPTTLDTDGTGANTLKIAKGEAVHEWSTDKLQITFVPVLVCKEPAVTVGLGDAISSSSFAAHL